MVYSSSFFIVFPNKRQLELARETSHNPLGT